MAGFREGPPGLISRRLFASRAAFSALRGDEHFFPAARKKRE